MRLKDVLSHILVCFYLLLACQAESTKSTSSGSSGKNSNKCKSTKLTADKSSANCDEKNSSSNSQAKSSASEEDEQSQENQETENSAGDDADINAFMQSFMNPNAGQAGEDGGVPSGDPKAVGYITNRKSSYTSPKLNDATGLLLKETYGSNERFYHCPGDSFLIGLKAKFEPEGEDREFHARCQFFETGDGKPIKKTECKTSSNPYNKAGQISAEFSCEEGTYLAGIRATFDSATKDRQMYFECCKMQTWDDKPVKMIDGEEGTPNYLACQTRIPAAKAQMIPDLAELVNDEVNELRQDLDFECKMGMMLRLIRSTFISDKHDRRFSFRCCSLSLE